MRRWRARLITPTSETLLTNMRLLKWSHFFACKVCDTWFDLYFSQSRCLNPFNQHIHSTSEKGPTLQECIITLELREPLLCVATVSWFLRGGTFITPPELTSNWNRMFLLKPSRVADGEYSFVNLNCIHQAAAIFALLVSSEYNMSPSCPHDGSLLRVQCTGQNSIFCLHLIVFATKVSFCLFTSGCKLSMEVRWMRSISCQLCFAHVWLMQRCICFAWLWSHFSAMSQHQKTAKRV